MEAAPWRRAFDPAAGRGESLVLIQRPIPRAGGCLTGADRSFTFEKSHPVTDTSTNNLGSRLKAAREARGIELRQVSVTTKISMSALEALERSDVSRLPGGIFSRAFVRAFAAEVGLDPETAVADFLEEFPTDVVDEEPVIVDDSEDHHVFQSQQRMANTVLSLLVLSLPVAGFLIFLGLRNGGDAEVDSPVDTPAVERAAGVSPDDTTRQPAAAVRATPPRVSTAPPVTPEPVGAEDPPVFEAAAVGPLTIDIHPSGVCWVSLTVDGERVFSRVMQPGEREVLEADREIIVNVGDAGAFAFAINQRPGRALGGSGEVVTARINRDNYRSFVTQ